MRVLTINAGSTSVKVERYDLSGVLPPIADPPSPAYIAAPPELDDDILAESLGPAVDVVAHRFVRMPDGTGEARRLDQRELDRIVACGADAPLHDAIALRAVQAVERLRPGIPQLAVSDSAFHSAMPEAATTYAIPRALTQSGLRRRGYHGLSHEYAAHRGSALAGVDLASARVVTAHLGGGSSLCAVLRGASIDTTMGYTPLDGLPMATRSGSVDPGLLIHLLRSGTSVDALDEMLERRSGLLGISGISGDVRELLAARSAPAATLALDVLAWRLRAALGAMAAVLGGIDVLVFTGGIGENAGAIRAAAVEGGLGLGIAIDEERKPQPPPGVRTSREDALRAGFTCRGDTRIVENRPQALR